MPLGGRKRQKRRGGHQQSAGLMSPTQGSRGPRDCCLPTCSFNQVRCLLVMTVYMLIVANGLWVLNFTPWKAAVHPHSLPRDSVVPSHCGCRSLPHYTDVGLAI